MALTVKQTDTKVASKRQAAKISEYAELKRMEDLLKAQIEKARLSLLSEFGEDLLHLTDRDGEVLATRVVPASSGKLDRKGLEKAHPRIFARFWTPGVEGAGTPRLIVH